MALSFFAVSGSGFGVEELIPQGGPALSLLCLLLAAGVWSAPMLLVASELSVALPRSGGYVVWVDQALGPFCALLNAVANLLGNVLDCSLYPLLLSEYVGEVVRASDPEGARTLPDSILAALRLMLVGLAAWANVRGVDVVGSAAGVMMLAVSLPFVALIAAAAGQPHADTSVWFEMDTADLPHGRSGWFTFLCLVLWNSCGYDSAGMVAAEVKAPRSTYPPALWGALALTTALYVLPLAAALAVASDWRAWEPGQYALLGAQLGGAPLELALTAASVVSMVGVLCTLLCTSSRAIAAMANLRMLPPALARLHTRHGTPATAIVANALLVGTATSFFRFEAALQLAMVFYAVNVCMQVAAVLRLRVLHPRLPRPRVVAPAPLLALPVALALLITALAPVRLLLVAGAVLSGTAAAYTLLSCGKAAVNIGASGSAALLGAPARRRRQAGAYEPVPGASRCAAAEMVAAFEMNEMEAEADDPPRLIAGTNAPHIRATVDTPSCNLPPLTAPWLTVAMREEASENGAAPGTPEDDGESLPGVI